MAARVGAFDLSLALKAMKNQMERLLMMKKTPALPGSSATDPGYLTSIIGNRN